MNNDPHTSSDPPSSDGERRLVHRKTGVIPGIIRLLDAYLMGYDVFISYSWCDSRKYAEKLVAAWKRTGIAAFWILPNIRWGAISIAMAWSPCGFQFGSHLDHPWVAAITSRQARNRAV